MSSNGRAGNGRGNNRRKPYRRRDNDSETWQKGTSAPGNNASSKNETSAAGEAQNRSSPNKKNNENTRVERGPYFERPRWVPPKMNTDPLPVSVCPWCGKPIRDISSAIADKDTGVPVHFDCVTSRITFGEKLEKGETVAYIGGGRFGVICFNSQGTSNNKTESREFTIKKIIEWENKEARAEWRSAISDQYTIL